MGTLAKDIVRPVATMVARPIQLAKAIGGATVEEQALDVPWLGKIETARTKKDVIKDVGRGIETVSFGLGGGAARGLVQRGVRAPLKTTVKAGVKEGAKIGAVGGFGMGLAEEGELGGAARGAVTGTVFGGALGGAIPAVSRGFGKVVEGRQAKMARTAEQAELLEKKIPDVSIAQRKLEKGVVVKDRPAMEAVRQGVPEADVALIKTSSATDKTKMAKMLKIRQSQLTNKRITARATDVVGDTFLQQAKFIAKKNREAGQKLNVVARRLAGKKVDVSSAMTSFADDLQNAGVSIKGNKLNFKGSNFEGIKSVQTAINNVWNRAIRVSKTGDALQLHRAKSYIDEVVEYGKKAEGLSGKAQLILKRFRHNADAVLDTNFKSYNRVNTNFAETIGELSKINQAMGRKFRLGDSFADARAGIVMRRILSNTQSRSDVLQLLESMQKVAKGQGMKIDDDIIAQANFADTLEKMLGSEAPTSFLGQIERGVGGAQEISGIATELGRGKPVAASIKAVGSAFQRARGINQESQIKALEGLLNIKPKTTLGKSVVKKDIIPSFKTNLKSVVDSINEGGITYDLLKQKNLGGKKYTSVGFYPERSKIFKGKLKEVDILKYARKNIDLLSKKNHALGGWYDKEAKQLWLDIAGIVKDEKTAIDWGKKLNQKAVFNLERFEELNTGGTGEMISKLPSIAERIKILEKINVKKGF